jgi:hypothetical protein
VTAATAIGASFRSFAAERGLADASGQVVEALTPLLARAEGTRLDPALHGELPGGFPAIVGRLRFLGGHAVGAAGGDEFAFLVVVTRVPESAGLVPRLFCETRGEPTTSTQYGLDLDSDSVWTESAALAARYEIRTSPYQDPNWMRQLFSPAFVDWLASSPPPGFAFELAYGDLVGSLRGERLAAAELDALWEATAAVAVAVRRESEEEV